MSPTTLKNFTKFTWTYEQFIQRRKPEPYDFLIIGTSYELDAPDKSTVFLLLFAGWDETTGDTTFYGLEAPVTCPMRQAFEQGEISWEDFWTREGQIYRFLVPFNPGPLRIDVIPTSQVNKTARDAFSYGTYSPYDIKHDRLRSSWEILPDAWKKKKAAAERSYKAYLARCGHRLTKKHAA
jgi:hypothetical protein